MIQCPKLCKYISQIAENESQALSGRDSFSAIRGKKASRQCTVSTIVEKFRVRRGIGSTDGNKLDGNAMIWYSSNGKR